MDILGLLNVSRLKNHAWCTWLTKWCAPVCLIFPSLAFSSPPWKANCTGQVNDISTLASCDPTQRLIRPLLTELMHVALPLCNNETDSSCSNYSQSVLHFAPLPLHSVSIMAVCLCVARAGYWFLPIAVGMRRYIGQISALASIVGWHQPIVNYIEFVISVWAFVFLQSGIQTEDGIIWIRSALSRKFSLVVFFAQASVCCLLTKHFLIKFKVIACTYKPPPLPSLVWIEIQEVAKRTRWQSAEA